MYYNIKYSTIIALAQYFFSITVIFFTYFIAICIELRKFASLILLLAREYQLNVRSINRK